MKNNQPYGYTGKPSPRRITIKNGKYFNPNKYGLGGLIGSGLGAIGGSFIGQPALGASIGGQAGALFDKEKMPEEPEEFNMGSGTLGTYKNGGYKSYAKGGYAKSMGKGSYKAVGRKHATGGIVMSPDTEIEGGETIDADSQGSYIFSDRLKVPKSKETFAERHEKLMSMNADKTAVNDLAEMQERVSGRKKRNLGNSSSDWGKRGTVMAKGGYKPNKYFTGGVVAGQVANDFAEENQPEAGLDEGGLDKWDYAAALAPTAVSALSGIFGKDKTKPAVQVKRTKIEGEPINYNVNPELQASSRAYRGILANPAASSQERLAALAGKGTNDARAYATKNNVEMQMKESRNARQAGLDANRNAQQASMNERYRQDKMAAEAQLGLTGNLSRQALSEAASTIMKLKAEGRMRDRDKQMEEFLRTYYGDDPAVLEFFGDGSTSEAQKKKVASTDQVTVPDAPVISSTMPTPPRPSAPSQRSSYIPEEPNINVGYSPLDYSQKLTPPTPTRPRIPVSRSNSNQMANVNIPNTEVDFSSRLDMPSSDRPYTPAQRPQDNIIESGDLTLNNELTKIDTELIENASPKTNRPDPTKASMSGMFNSNDVDTTITKGSINLPIEGEITKGFGVQTHPKFGTKTPSLGVNIKTSPNQPIKSVGNGVVKRVGNISGHGNAVIVDHNGTLVVYGNLGSIGVKEGDTITRDNPIGNSGENDVFFSIRENGKMVDPLTWINK